MNDWSVRPSARIVPSPFHQGPQIGERDTAVNLHERAVNQMLELGWIQQPSAGQGQQMPPGFRGKSPSLMRPQHAESHVTDPT